MCIVHIRIVHVSVAQDTYRWMYLVYPSFAPPVSPPSALFSVQPASMAFIVMSFLIELGLSPALTPAMIFASCSNVKGVRVPRRSLCSMACDTLSTSCRHVLSGFCTARSMTGHSLWKLHLLYILVPIVFHAHLPWLSQCVTFFVSAIAHFADSYPVATVIHMPLWSATTMAPFTRVPDTTSPARGPVLRLSARTSSKRARSMIPAARLCSSNFFFSF